MISRFICNVNLSYHIGKRIYPQLLWRDETSENHVYITFDDGPQEEITPWVLDLLKQYDVKATFFVVGENAVRHPDLIQRIVSEGHSIGNHTFHHMKGWGADSREYLDDIELCKNSIPPTILFRPPYGRINGKSLTELDAYTIVMWDVLSKDYKSGLNTEKALERMKKQTTKGSIIVFHDSIKASRNVKVLLPAYLQYLQGIGLSSKAL